MVPCHGVLSHQRTRSKAQPIRYGGGRVEGVVTRGIFTTFYPTSVPQKLRGTILQSNETRAGGIRTHDLLNPIQAHYQAVLQPVSDYGGSWLVLYGARMKCGKIVMSKFERRGMIFRLRMESSLRLEKPYGGEVGSKITTIHCGESISLDGGMGCYQEVW